MQRSSQAYLTNDLLHLLAFAVSCVKDSYTYLTFSNQLVKGVKKISLILCKRMAEIQLFISVSKVTHPLGADT